MSKNQFLGFRFFSCSGLKSVVVVLGLFFRKKSVVVVFRGSGCSGFFLRIRPTGRIREIFRIWCSGFKLVVVVLNECEVEVRAPKGFKSVQKYVSKPKQNP